MPEQKDKDDAVAKAIAAGIAQATKKFEEKMNEYMIAEKWETIVGNIISSHARADSARGRCNSGKLPSLKMASRAATPRCGK